MNSKKQCERNEDHDFEYKEIVKQERFDTEMKNGNIVSTGKRFSDKIFAVFICKECEYIERRQV